MSFSERPAAGSGFDNNLLKLAMLWKKMHFASQKYSFEIDAVRV
jgi:hypothetical protein